MPRDWRDELPSYYGYLDKMFRTYPKDARDELCQRVMLRLLTRSPFEEGRGCTLKSWVIRIAKWEVARFAKEQRLGSHVHFSEELEGFDPPCVEEGFRETERPDVLKEIEDVLTPREHGVLVLTVDNATYEELAFTFDVSTSRIQQIKQDAYKKIRNRLPHLAT